MSDAKMGVKIEKEEAAQMDPKLNGGTILPQAEAAVEGQYCYCARVICPWCRSLLRVMADTNYFKWFTCCVCGGTFRF